MSVTVRRTVAQLHDIDLTAIARDLLALDDLNQRHPSTPDGYPTQTPGAAPATSNGHTGGVDVKLTSVEAAADARRHSTGDPYHAIQANALRAIHEALDRLDRARHLLDQVRHVPADRAALNPEPGCWAMGRIGAWEPVLCVTDLSTVLGHPLDEPRPLGRWAYDFAKRAGRLPTVDECKRRQLGQRVMVDA